MKTVLVTGGAGYIGSHTVVELINNGYNVIIIDDFSNSNPRIISNLHKLLGKVVKIYSRDVKEQFDDIIQLENIDSIIHFAAFKSVEESVENPQKYYDNNINSLLSVLDHCKHLNINNLIFSSSCSVYGEYYGSIDESSKLNPKSPYAWTKMVCEKIIEDYCIVNPNMNAIALRYFNPIGAHDSALIGELPSQEPINLVPVICQSVKFGKKMKVYGNDWTTHDGTCIRDYIHVSDVANAHVLALNKIINKNGYGVYNIGSENGSSVLEVINTFEKVTGLKVDYEFVDRRKGDVMSIWADSAKAKKDLNWRCKYNLDQMIESAWKWENSTNR